MAKKIFYADQARDKVLSGAKQLYDAVKVTFGPKGQNVVIEKSMATPPSPMTVLLLQKLSI